MVTPCHKQRYASKQLARAALAALSGKRQGRRQGAETRIYWCVICNGWHLTSMGRKQR